MLGDWQDYFEYKSTIIDGKRVDYYEYKDKSVEILPVNLSMPPTVILFGVFSQCNQLKDISALSNWNVSNVEIMGYMFYYCPQLKNLTPLANWNVTKVKDTGCMFYNCQQLQDITPLANWDVSNVKSMGCMFSVCHRLKDITALANWDVSKVESMRCMFSYCSQLEDITALANWNVSNVKNMEDMFNSYRRQFNIPNDTDSIKSHLRNLSKHDYTSLLNSLWESVKPLLKDATPLNNHFKRYTVKETTKEPNQKAILLDLPSDWQEIELIQWNP